MAKRGQGEGTISKRPDGTWWARITLGKDEDGKQKRKAFYGKTRKEVQEKLTAAINDINNDSYIEPSKMTVAQWMDIWLRDYKKSSIKPKVHYVYYKHLENHIKPGLGNYKLKELRSDIIQNFINELSGKGLSPSTVAGVYARIHGALEQAVKNELISRNVAIGTTLPKKLRSDVKALTREEQTTLIEVLKTSYQGEAFILDLATGLRMGELMALTWSDIDFDNGTVQVSKTQIELKPYGNEVMKSRIIYGPPKTISSNRTVPLLPSIVNMLKQLQENQLEHKRKMGNCYYDNNLIFCNFEGNPIPVSEMRRKFKRVTKKVGIEGIHPHCLRHTFATRGLENGIELKVMQELLGHATIGMTANLYTHVMPDKKKDSIMKLKDTIKLD